MESLHVVVTSLRLNGLMNPNSILFYAECRQRFVSINLTRRICVMRHILELVTMRLMQKSCNVKFARSPNHDLKVPVVMEFCFSTRLAFLSNFCPGGSDSHTSQETQHTSCFFQCGQLCEKN